MVFQGGCWGPLPAAYQTPGNPTPTPIRGRENCRGAAYRAPYVPGGAGKRLACAGAAKPHAYNIPELGRAKNGGRIKRGPMAGRWQMPNPHPKKSGRNFRGRITSE